MAETAALLVDEILPHQPLRQWVLRVLFPLRFLFASRPDVMGRVVAIVHRAIATHLIRKAGFTHKTACTVAVTQVQRFGSGAQHSFPYAVPRRRLHRGRRGQFTLPQLFPPMLALM